MGNSIVPVQERQLVGASSTDVSAMVHRLRSGLKDQEKLKDDEIIALATMSIAHNLDPFNGECWAIPGKGVMAGVKGLRKAADGQLPPGAHRHPNLRILQSQEYEDYGLNEKQPPNAWDNSKKAYVPNPIKLAAICELTRSDATQTYINQLCQLTGSNVPYDDAVKVMGARPVWIGIGIVRIHDKSKMELGQLAFKRAESDALKKAFNLPFAAADDRDSEEYVDGEAWETYTDEQQATPLPDGELGRPYPAETVREGIQSRAKKKTKPASDKQKKYARTLLINCYKESATADQDRHLVQVWLGGPESSNDFTSGFASAIIEWLADETGDLGMDGYQEAQAVLTAAMRDAGQLPLEGLE